MQISTDLITAAGYGIYGALALIAFYGLFLVVLLLRQIGQKQFRGRAQAEEFLQHTHALLQKRDFDGIASLCNTPPHWTQAVPQLILLAVQQRDREITRLRRMVGEQFERDVLADLEYRMSWISTIIKSAPMLGLLGTVTGMIAAFAKISAVTRETGTDPAQLANDISFALITTAVGLLIAIPLVMISAAINVRIGKLQDSVQHQMGIFLEDMDDLSPAASAGGRP